MSLSVNRLPLVLLAGLLVTGPASWANGQCASDVDAKATRRTTKQMARCNDKVLRSGPGSTCTVDPPPGCAGSLPIDAMALAYGPNDPGLAAAAELSDQRRCQRRIGKGVADFTKKLLYITKGLTPADAELRARRTLDKVADLCAVPVAADPVSGVVLPAVGPQCAAAIPTVGGVVNAVALRD